MKSKQEILSAVKLLSSDLKPHLEPIEDEDCPTEWEEDIIDLSCSLEQFIMMNR